MKRALYKRLLTEVTAHDFNARCVDSSSPSRRKLKKRIMRIARKRNNNLV